MGFEQEETLLETGPEGFPTFVLKVRFREAVKRPPQAAPQFRCKGCTFPRAALEHKIHKELNFLSLLNS